MDDSELIRRLNSIADFEVTSFSVERALDRTRFAITNSSTIRSLPRRRLNVSSLAAAISFIIGTVLLTLWLFTPLTTSNFALAEVLEKVEKTRSVTMTWKSADEQGKLQTFTAYGLSDGRLRFIEPDGGYSVVDPARERSLAVNPAKKEALLIKGYFNRGPANFYQMLRDIGKNEVKKLPAERIDGKEFEVFLARLKTEQEEQQLKVWVNPKTALPQRIEATYKEKPDQQMTIELKFDEPVDEKLFSTEPPEGYKLRTEGVDAPPAPRKDDEKLLAPEVKPKEGIGTIKFGMSKDQVIASVGAPDKIDQKGVALDYLSRGYSVLISPTRGVIMINCYSQAIFVVKVKDFAGKTKDGIGMGSTSAEIIKVFGKPDSTEKEGATTRLNYRKSLGLEFMLGNDKVMNFSLSPVK